MDETTPAGAANAASWPGLSYTDGALLRRSGYGLFVCCFVCSFCDGLPLP